MGQDTMFWCGCGGWKERHESQCSACRAKRVDEAFTRGVAYCVAILRAEANRDDIHIDTVAVIRRLIRKIDGVDEP